MGGGQKGASGEGRDVGRRNTTVEPAAEGWRTCAVFEYEVVRERKRTDESEGGRERESDREGERGNEKETERGSEKARKRETRRPLHLGEHRRLERNGRSSTQRSGEGEERNSGREGLLQDRRCRNSVTHASARELCASDAGGAREAVEGGRREERSFRSPRGCAVTARVVR